MFKMQKIPRPVVILGLVSLFNDTASEMIYPIVPIFLTTVLHTPITDIGIIEGIAEGTASLFKFIFGFWSDKLQRRKIFVTLGYSFGGVSKAVIGFATIWQWVLFARIIDRLGKGLRTAARDAILLQNATPQNKGFIFGFHRAMDSAGAVIGPLIALGLIQLFHNNLRLTFFIAVVPSVVCLLLLILFIKERKKDVTKTTKSFRFSLKGINKTLLLFFLVSMVFALGNSADSFLILRANNLGLTTFYAILAYALYNLSQTIFSTPAGSWADRIGARKVYAYGLVLFALVYLGFGFIQSSWFIWPLFVVYGVYIAFTDGVSKSYIAEFISQKESGSYFGLYQMLLSVCTLGASVIAGLLWDNISAAAPFYFGGIMALLAFAILLYGKAIHKL